MRHFILLILLSSVFARCGRKEDNFEYWVRLFIDEAAARGVDIDYNDIPPISMEKIDGVSYSKSIIVGQCNYDTRSIRIDEEDWDVLLDFQREATIFHELGHCLLNIAYHTDYAGYMYYQIPSYNAKKHYDEHRSEWIDDLLSLEPSF